MIVTTSSRIALVGLSLVLLAGCASSAARSGPAEDYFAHDLPGLPGHWDPMMSPVNNPILQARGLHNPPPTLVREALLAQHQRWVGTPYRLGGSTVRGIDCSALVQNVFSDTFRLELPRTTTQQAREGMPVTRDALRPGDLVFFRPPGAYRHVGIYVGEGRFLHASTSRGVRLSSLDSRYWQRYYWQARRPLESTRLARRLEPGLLASGEG